MNNIVRFKDNGTIKKLAHKTYTQDGAFGIFKYWDIPSSEMVCNEISEDEVVKLMGVQHEDN